MGEVETESEEAQVTPLDASVVRAASHRYSQTLDKTLRSAVVPYGYTVTVWASGAYLIGLRGVPSLLEAFAFVAGAIAAFGLLSALSQRGGTDDRDLMAPPIHPDSAHPIFAAGIHIAAVGLSFGAAFAVNSIAGNAAWFFGSFAVTLIYLSIASAEMAIAIELHRREIGASIAGVVTHPRRVVRRVVRRNPPG